MIKKFNNDSLREMRRRQINRRLEMNESNTILCGTGTKPVYLKDGDREEGKRVWEETMNERKSFSRHSSRAKKFDEKNSSKNLLKFSTAMLEKHAKRIVKLLKEEGEDLSVDAVQPEATEVDPAVSQAIESLKASIETLSNALNLTTEPAPDEVTGADAQADIPAVTGENPIATVESVKDRIKARQAKIQKNFETESPFDGVDPQEKSESAGDWPLEPCKVKESASEKMVTEAIAEKNNNWSLNKIIREGILDT